MILTTKLVGMLYRRLRRDPAPVADIVFQSTLNVGWTVADAVLTLEIGPNTLTYDLTATTLIGLALTLDQVPNVQVTQYPTASRQGMLAAVLIDGTGLQVVAGTPLITQDGYTLTTDQGVPIDAVLGGSVTLSGYSRLSWAYLDACASELQLALDATEAAPAEIVLNTASGTWVDLHGSYYQIVRANGETDAAYATRIIVETLSPRSNNVAMAAAIQRYTGLAVQVVDVTIYTPNEPSFDGRPEWNGVYNFDPASYPVYGLFDVLVSAASVTATQIAAIQLVVGTVRAGGTQLRNITAIG